MDAVDYKRDVDDSLARLERQLELPIVPGELATWFENVRVAFDEFGEPFRQRIEIDHPPTLKQIKRDADNLLRRVEQLQKEDAELLTTYDKLQRCAGQLCKMVANAEPNEAKFDEHIRDATAEGLAFVLRVRTQELAIETWLQESLLRDNGQSGAG